MSALVAMLAIIPLADQAVKLLLRRTLGSRAMRLGPFVDVHLVRARIWRARVGGRSTLARMWAMWSVAAGTLTTVAILMPASGLFIGLLLGGSLSHGLEMSLRGSVSDYICLRFWRAFNLADVAITAGAIGIVAHASIALQYGL